jgi:hypothetical protein
MLRQVEVDSGGEGGIVAPIAEQEVRSWRALVCLLFSTGPVDFNESSMFKRLPEGANRRKLVAK